MPVIKTQDKIKTLLPGALLKVYCTDPGVEADIPAWCRINGHKVLHIEKQALEICLTIEVGNQ